MNLTKPIWKSPCNEFTADSAWAFIQRLKTWNEAESAVQSFPDKAYLQTLANLWFETVSDGNVLVVEKCRRMLISWLFRGLELWLMGVRRTDHVLCGLDLPAAASHCWRYLLLYNQLRKDCPEWKLPAARIITLKGPRLIEDFSLPNGSRTRIHNQMGGGLQGEGFGLVTMEELSRYRSPASIWSQGKIVTQGSGGSRGAVIAVTNAAMNEEWKRIKA